MLTDYIDKTTANVYGIYGHLGGGKSLSAVEISIWALKLGWTVVSNIRLYNIDKYKSHFHLIDDLTSLDFWSLPCGAPRGSRDKFRVVIVIDECAEFFDQFSSTSPVLKNFLSWLRHSSKRGQFVFLIVQQPEFIAKSLRLLVNKWIVCFDMAQYRLPMIRLKIPFTRHLVARRIFDKYGNLISRGANFADKYLIGHYYDTAQSIAVRGRSYNYRKSSDDSTPDFFAVLLMLTIIYIMFLMLYK